MSLTVQFSHWYPVFYKFSPFSNNLHNLAVLNSPHLILQILKSSVSLLSMTAVLINLSSKVSYLNIFSFLYSFFFSLLILFTYFYRFYLFLPILSAVISFWLKLFFLQSFPSRFVFNHPFLHPITSFYTLFVYWKFSPSSLIYCSFTFAVVTDRHNIKKLCLSCLVASQCFRLIFHPVVRPLSN